MEKVDTKHRKYQVLKWIQALEGAYPSGDRVYPPTLSNLALHMTEAGVREDALVRLYGHGALRKPYNKEMLNHVKRHLYNLIGKYDTRLFNIRKTPKTERNSYGMELGIESDNHRGHEITTYYLSTQGRRELNHLHELVKSRHEIVPTTYRQDSVDKIIVPKIEGRRSWWTTEIVLAKRSGIYA